MKRGALRYSAGLGCAGVCSVQGQGWSKAIRTQRADRAQHFEDKSCIQCLRAPQQSRKSRRRALKRSQKSKKEGFDPLHFTDDPARSQFLREAEVLHARWAMLGVLGLIVPDLLGGELYLLPDLGTQRLIPFTIQLLVAVGVLEGYRGAVRAEHRGLDERAYPGRRIDFLGLGNQKRAERGKEPVPGLGVYSAWLGGLPGWLSGGWWYSRREMTVQELRDMKAKELNNGRLAMVSFMGVYAASMLTGKGPITLLMQHVADPVNNTVFQTLGPAVSSS